MATGVFTAPTPFGFTVTSRFDNARRHFDKLFGDHKVKRFAQYRDRQMQLARQNRQVDLACHQYGLGDHLDDQLLTQTRVAQDAQELGRIAAHRTVRRLALRHGGYESQTEVRGWRRRRSNRP